MLRNGHVSFSAEEHEAFGACPSPKQERMLLAALLERAIMDLRDNVEQAVCRQAIAWFESSDPTDVEFSFNWVVEHLELSGARIAKIQGFVHEAKERLKRRVEYIKVRL